MLSSVQALRGDPVLPGHSDLEAGALCIMDLAGIALPWGPSGPLDDPFEVRSASPTLFLATHAQVTNMHRCMIRLLQRRLHLKCICILTPI